jgi:hypothetical protein
MNYKSRINKFCTIIFKKLKEKKNLLKIFKIKILDYFKKEKI